MGWGWGHRSKPPLLTTSLALQLSLQIQGLVIILHTRCILPSDSLSGLLKYEQKLQNFTTDVAETTVSCQMHSTLNTPWKRY